MARSRNIKPGFFTNDVLAECEPLARLLFAGLWTEADREGRLEDRPKKLKAAILPYDNCDADALLQQLAERGFILRYQDGANFIQIVSFGKHQDPHYKEKASEIPPPPGHVDTGKTAGSPSDELRAKIIARDGACVQCSSANDLTLDHIIPRSKGGSHVECNLQTLCRRCNAGKNNREARPIIGQSSANHQGGESPLIPDSLIPDSLQEKSNLTVAPAQPTVEPSALALVASPTPKPKGPPDCPHRAVLALWAEVLPHLPQHLPSQWRGARAEHLRARWRETAVEKGWVDEAQGLAYLRKLFGFVGQSMFLTGKSPPRGDKRPFVIELEWLANPTNWAKVIEGKYHQESA